jgi:hypothetical protein
MKHVLIRTLGGSGLLLFSLAANAQTTSEQISNPFHSQDQYGLTHSMFDKVTADLHEAQTDANSLDDGFRLVSANSQLRQLERSWDQDHYVSREMESTISAIQMILTDKRLMPRDRDALSSDLSQLLDFKTEYY